MHSLISILTGNPDIMRSLSNEYVDVYHMSKTAIFTLPFSVNGVESSVLAEITMRLQVYYMRAQCYD